MSMDKIIADVHLLVEAERERKGLPKWDWSAPKSGRCDQTPGGRSGAANTASN
jgi:hypothetical protein